MHDFKIGDRVYDVESAHSADFHGTVIGFTHDSVIVRWDSGIGSDPDGCDWFPEWLAHEEGDETFTVTPEQVGRQWNPADRARLPAIRDRVDPTGLFATNIHIG